MMQLNRAGEAFMVEHCQGLDKLCSLQPDHHTDNRFAIITLIHSSKLICFLKYYPAILFPELD